MKTNIRTLIVILIATLAGAVGASAQAGSLANIGHDIYRSEADGFEIAVPHDCFKVTAADNGRVYVCDVKEGRITVHPQTSDPAVNTDAEVAAYLEGFRGTLKDAANVKVLSETPLHIGDYRGAEFQLTFSGGTVYMTTLCHGRTTITVTGQASQSVPNAAKLIGTAVESFTFPAKAK
ncbi:MAG: hypothetical protein ACJ73D_05780 [Pyrinomonadaceae bacterium]